MGASGLVCYVFCYYLVVFRLCRVCVLLRLGVDRYRAIVSGCFVFLVFIRFRLSLSFVCLVMFDHVWFCVVVFGSVWIGLAVFGFACLCSLVGIGCFFLWFVRLEFGCVRICLCVSGVVCFCWLLLGVVL